MRDLGHRDFKIRMLVQVPTRLSPSLEKQNSRPLSVSRKSSAPKPKLYDPIGAERMLPEAGKARHDRLRKEYDYHQAAPQCDVIGLQYPDTTS